MNRDNQSQPGPGPTSSHNKTAPLEGVSGAVWDSLRL